MKALRAFRALLLPSLASAMLAINAATPRGIAAESPVVRSPPPYFEATRPAAAAAARGGSDSAATENKLKMLVLPGFVRGWKDYLPLVDSLNKRGAAAAVLGVSRMDWLRVIRHGRMCPAFANFEADWMTPAYQWYLDMARDAIERESRDSELVLVAHSAGGWLTRALLRREGEAWHARDKLKAVITLGSPHVQPAGLPKTACPSRGVLSALAAADRLRPPTVPFVCVAGAGLKVSPFSVYVGNSGDGLVPHDSAVLEYAAARVFLDGASHCSSLSSDWYGADHRVDQWLQPALAALDLMHHTNIIKVAASRFGKNSKQRQVTATAAG